LPGVMRLVEKYYYVESPERKVFGLKFPSPIGLAAGFDKNAQVIDEMASLGFGFVEIGTVTPLPQIGNPKPRLFRLKKDQGIINRMGFNNDGMEAIVERLKKKKKNIIIGGNIGKNKVTPNEQAKDDYLKAFRALFGYVDYFVVNVSSPNTPNLRALQEKGPLMEILQALQEKNQAYPCPKPILLKIAPDLNESQLDEIIEVVLETKLEGVIATNTTISREGLRSSAAKIEQIGNGGLSGLPLRDRSTEVIRYLHQKSQGAFAIMGVGGIHRPEDAIEKLKAGASLVQVYTGFVYEGPGLIKKIKQQAKELRMVGQE
ncbi:MAG: quinone-dependent dihydroorotate dehydrogenase, partial [Bacteroidota bacterium]